MIRMFRLLAFAAVFTVVSASANHPNVIVILADDMGYGDVRALNPNSKIPTPGLDKLAAEGATFLDAHTPSSVCTPTRYGLLAGRYCWRTRLKRGVLNGYGEPLIAPDRLLISGFLKQHGYYTGIVGKWHLGLGFQKRKNAPKPQGKGRRRLDGSHFDFTKPLNSGPHTLGFDYSFIIPASLDFPPYVYIRDGQLTKQPTEAQDAQGFPAYLRKGERSPDLVMEDCLDDLLKDAQAFVKRRADKKDPFFLYFPLTAPHKPVLPHPRFEGKTKLGAYGDFVSQVDYTVGELVKTVDDLGLKKNTIIIYTSDNGSFMYRLNDMSEPDHLKDETVQKYHPKNHTANGPWRGTKADIWEAGHHVPFFVRWPARVKAGLKIDHPICLTDIYMTLGEIIGAECPTGMAPDSYSFLTLLHDNPSRYRRAPVIHHSSGGMFALRLGDWKLVLGNGSGGREQPRGKAFERPYHLFNLKNDPGETENLIAKEPKLAKQLEAAFELFHQNERN